MTTNDATARAHVAMTILFVDRDKPDELIAANWEARKDRNSGLESQEELLRYADNAIAAHSEYLWQAADSYDFFDALEEWVQTNDNHEPEMIAKFTVEYLIGPKPQGDKR